MMTLNNRVSENNRMADTAPDAEAATLRWDDRVYGPTTIDVPNIVRLIHCPTFQRLRGIRQAGPSAFAHPFKTVTRYEHSLGVYVLLNRLGAEPVEQVAGLLHDISHTAFSHAVDFIYESEEQAHHELLKPQFLNRPDIVTTLSSMGYAPELFYHDTIYTLLERPLPWLCADRIDYFLRDARSCGVLDANTIGSMLDALVVHDGMICVNSVAAAVKMRDKFAEMNERWWSGPTEAFIYNEFADALREGLASGVLQHADLLGDDEHVMSRLRAAESAVIQRKLAHVMKLPSAAMRGYCARVAPKLRWLDPPVLQGGKMRPLSQIETRRGSRSRSAKAG
jgi:HD superfamily phosphohydrolase